MLNFFAGVPTAFVAFFLVVALLVAAGFVLAIVMAIRNARNLRRHGIDPLAADSELLLRVTAPRGGPGGTGGSSVGTVEERLAELGRLRDAGTISSGEHDAARARILGSL